MLLAWVLLVQQPDVLKAADAAARKGIPYLETQVADPDLRLLALVKHRDSDLRPALNALIAETLSTPPATVRSAALQAAAFADLDPWKYRPRIAHCAQLLLDSQAADGFWGPGSAVEDPGIPVERKPVTLDPLPSRRRLVPRGQAVGAGDPVNASWAGFGLLASNRAAFYFPVEVAMRAADAWKAEGLDPVDVVVWRSTFLHLARRAEFRVDPAVQAAYRRLGDTPLPETPRDWFRLHLATTHLDWGRFQKRPSYDEGVAALIAVQKPDGSWGDVESTACALLYLSRRFEPLHRSR